MTQPLSPGGADVDEIRAATIRDRRERERRVWRLGFALSVILHLLLLLVGSPPPLPDSPFSAAGPRADDDRAAEGAMVALQLSSAPPTPAVPEPLPIPAEVDPPEIEEVEPDATPEEPPEPDLPEVPLPGVGDTQGADPEPTTGDTGLPTGAGQGDGGTEEEGRFRLVPPTPRGIIPFYPTGNNPLRDREIQVWVFVNAEGRVVPDSTRLEPPTSDRRFNEQIRAAVAQWVFNPAREDGRPVSSWYPYTLGGEER